MKRGRGRRGGREKSEDHRHELTKEREEELCDGKYPETKLPKRFSNHLLKSGHMIVT